MSDEDGGELDRRVDPEAPTNLKENFDLLGLEGEAYDDWGGYNLS